MLTRLGRFATAVLFVVAVGLAGSPGLADEEGELAKWETVEGRLEPTTTVKRTLKIHTRSRVSMHLSWARRGVSVPFEMTGSRQATAVRAGEQRAVIEGLMLDPGTYLLWIGRPGGGPETAFRLRVEVTPLDGDGFRSVDEEMADPRIELGVEIAEEISWADGDHHDWHRVELPGPGLLTAALDPQAVDAGVELLYQVKKNGQQPSFPRSGKGVKEPSSLWLVVRGPESSPKIHYRLRTHFEPEVEAPAPTACDAPKVIRHNRFDLEAGRTETFCSILRLPANAMVLLDGSLTGVDAVLRGSDGRTIELVEEWSGPLTRGDWELFATLRGGLAKTSADFGFVICEGVRESEGRVTGPDPLERADSFLVDLGARDSLLEGNEGQLEDGRAVTVVEVRGRRARVQLAEVGGPVPRRGSAVTLRVGSCE